MQAVLSPPIAATPTPTPAPASLLSAVRRTIVQTQTSIAHFFRPPGQTHDGNTKLVRKTEDEERDVKRSKGTIAFETKSGKVPLHKTIPNTSFAVDAFTYGAIAGIRGYFLTHFHSDHYRGLTKAFMRACPDARLYCSSTTANLVESELQVDAETIVRLEPGHAYTVDGVQVGVLDANQYQSSHSLAHRV